MSSLQSPLRSHHKFLSLSSRINSGAVCALLFIVVVFMTCAPNSSAQSPRSEYRAFWVDTFNTALNNHANVVAVVNNAKAAKANAIFAQVRRRGDSWYLSSLEPAGDRTPIQPGFDPLGDLINEAHANGIEVHAFVIMGAVWGRSPQLFPPENPNHVFNRHGGYDRASNTIVTDSNNWLTRTLIPDGTGQITYQGYRFNADFWIDFGHPDAAAYTVDVLMHLVRNYEIDGLHLDRIRYPEINIAGQTPSTGTSVGYNSTSIERFQKHHGIAAGSAPPAQNNPQWNQWRRDQVTNVVRRVYLNALAIKPQLKISGSYIAFGGIGSTEAAWNSAEAYWRIYQDWRAWTEEGITDIAIPMAYKAEHSASVRPQFDQWDRWLKSHQYGRTGMMGQGALLNSIEGTLPQVRRTLAPDAQGRSHSGVIFFSMATSNIAVANNPLAIPEGQTAPATQNTPARSFAEFASGLTTSKSVNGMRLYESTTLNPTPIFAEAATIPVLPWKANPTFGHIKGFAKRADDTPLDTATVTFENLDTHETRTGATDGGGFFGSVDLAPGSYLVKIESGADVLYSCVATVTAGTVTTADARVENTAPVTTATIDPSSPSGTNNWYTGDVTISLAATDDCTGVRLTEYSIDNGATWQPFTEPLTISTEGSTTVLYRSSDRAGNVETAKGVTIKLDKSAPTASVSADPSSIFPPNGKTVTVTISGTAQDAVSGLAGVIYTVEDEYGSPLSIAPRALEGATATWTDVLGVEARRRGDDRDGRLYRITATVTDQAGNSTTAATQTVVLHDRGK